ncbi:MAG: efflux transporter outer membrane subunit [Methylohalobius sp. ZOD2]|nr:efflux transporter outer membrane subunit [Methylothermaceae bacterium]
MTWKTVNLGMCLLLLNGCISAPPRDGTEILGETLPARWSAIGERAAGCVTEGWVASFGQPALSDLVREALAYNHDLKAVAARVEIARARARIAGAPRLPQLEAGPGFRRGRLGTGEDHATEGAWEVLFNLSWELDVWGRIRAAQEAARWEADAAEVDLRGAALSLAARTAQTWFEWIEARLQEEVAAQSAADRRMLVALVRGRFQRGLTRGLDLSLALTDLEGAKAQLADARNRVQSLARRLEVLLGRYPGAELETALELPPLPPSLPAGVPAELLGRRPDVAAAMARLKARDQRLASARAALLPRFTLTGEGGLRSAALKSLVAPEALAWNAAAGLLQPIFTGGRLRGEIALNQAASQEALEMFQQTALDALREVEEALAAEEWLRAQERALQETVEQTAASRKLAVYAYRQGFIEILTLLDSFRSTLNAQSAHLAVQRRLLNNRIALYLALGGGV